MTKINYERQVLNGWIVGKPLGSGGNGIVYWAKQDSKIGAIKILKEELWTGKRYQRFIDEVEGMKRCKQIKGVIPLLDFNVPEKPSKSNPPFIVMELAEPLIEALGTNPTLEKIVEVCLAIAEVLTAMHALGIAHRDIKPDNLFQYQGNWVIGDLGLVDFDGKTAITAEGEKLGPMFYIAPEMLNNSHLADGKPADVFSFAKTLWVLGTGYKYPLPGEMRTDFPANRLSTYVVHTKAKYLDRLIESETRDNPKLRPTIAEFAQELRLFLLPTVESTSLEDLSEITRRLTTAREPALRAEQIKAQLIKEAQDLLEELKVKLQPLNVAICRAAGVDSTPIYFKPPNNRFAYAQTMGAPASLWGNGNWIVLETPGHFPVRYYCGLSVEVLGDSTVRVAAGHLIYSDRLYNETLWGQIVTARLGSAELEHDIAGLINGLTEKLPDALRQYASKVEQTP